MSQHALSIAGPTLLMDGAPFLATGLRCSNALVTDAAADELIANLPTFAAFGVNCVSVFLMGSRFGDVRGYREDAALDPVYAARLARFLVALDDLALAAIVGCLYWGDSRAKWERWTLADAERAVANTARWLAEGGHAHALLDVDNEGMAQRAAGFGNRALVLAAKAAAPGVLAATNCEGEPPPEADLGLHFATPVADRPYIESEGSPSNAPGRYWGAYSKQEGFYGYLNVGVYTPAMIGDQCAATRRHLEQGHGYLLASTWLQAGPPQGPNHRPGGLGTLESPGVRWWLEWLQTWYLEGVDEEDPYDPDVRERIEARRPRRRR